MAWSDVTSGFAAMKMLLMRPQRRRAVLVLAFIAGLVAVSTCAAISATVLRASPASSNS